MYGAGRCYGVTLQFGDVVCRVYNLVDVWFLFQHLEGEGGELGQRVLPGYPVVSSRAGRLLDLDCPHVCSYARECGGVVGATAGPVEGKPPTSQLVYGLRCLGWDRRR